tara:strand:- start:607 stop:816 length:210 start_codon:yes stop_codon:yes gene_type:complete
MSYDVFYTSDWCLDDVDNILELRQEEDGMLTTEEKANCLIDLVNLLSGLVGMEYLEEIVLNKLKSKEQS